MLNNVISLRNSPIPWFGYISNDESTFVNVHVRIIIDRSVTLTEGIHVK